MSNYLILDLGAIAFAFASDWACGQQLLEDRRFSKDNHWSSNDRIAERLFAISSGGGLRNGRWDDLLILA